MESKTGSPLIFSHSKKKVSLYSVTKHSGHFPAHWFSFPLFKFGVIKPQPVAAPSYWFYCGEPRDILMMYGSINGNWWDGYWWRMVHFPAIHRVPVAWLATHHLWKSEAAAHGFWSTLLVWPFPGTTDERAIIIKITWHSVPAWLCGFTSSFHIAWWKDGADYPHFPDKETEIQSK